MELEVVKVEEGLCSGEVLFHAHQTRSAEEVARQKAAFRDREALRAKRRREQVPHPQAL
jgi:ribosome biogenesis protein SSF1/2